MLCAHLWSSAGQVHGALAPRRPIHRGTRPSTRSSSRPGVVRSMSRRIQDARLSHVVLARDELHMMVDFRGRAAVPSSKFGIFTTASSSIRSTAAVGPQHIQRRAQKTPQNTAENPNAKSRRKVCSRQPASTTRTEPLHKTTRPSLQCSSAAGRTSIVRMKKKEHSQKKKKRKFHWTPNFVGRRFVVRVTCRSWWLVGRAGRSRAGGRSGSEMGG